jgi:hypothetical protein
MYEKKIEDDHHLIKLEKIIFKKLLKKLLYLVIRLHKLVKRVSQQVKLFELDKMMINPLIIQMQKSKLKTNSLILLFLSTYLCI